MGLKLSRFNYLKDIDGQLVFFNAKTCALAIVDSGFQKILKDFESDQFDEANCDKKLLSDMLRSGCVVPEGLDELKEFRFNRDIRRFNTDNLQLTIAPTLDCNFSCTYCFETHKKGKMTTETQDCILKFIESKSKKLENLSIAWFGGEPLVAKDIIYGLSEKIISLCMRNHISYNASIVTNGSLFLESDVQQFKNAHIRRAQITIDGPPEVHDVRRKFLSGTATFEHVLRGVQIMLDHDIKVAVRVNIDKENLHTIDKLLQILKNRVDGYERLVLSFAPVLPLTTICKSIENNCIEDKDFAYLYLQLQQMAVAMGFDQSKQLFFPRPKYNNCAANLLNSFVIDVDGNLYKCWNQVGMSEQTCGNVCNLAKFNTQNLIDWIEWDPLDFPKCRECSLLPVCAGGCQHLANIEQNGVSPKCIQMKHYMDSFIKFYIPILMQGGEKNEL